MPSLIVEYDLVPYLTIVSQNISRFSVFSSTCKFNGNVTCFNAIDDETAESDLNFLVLRAEKLKTGYLAICEGRNVVDVNCGTSNGFTISMSVGLLLFLLRCYAY